jgi:predicted PilT family ATPase
LQGFTITVDKKIIRETIGGASCAPYIQTIQ